MEIVLRLELMQLLYFRWPRTAAGATGWHNAGTTRACLKAPIHENGAALSYQKLDVSWPARSMSSDRSLCHDNLLHGDESCVLGLAFS